MAPCGPVDCRRAGRFPVALRLAGRAFEGRRATAAHIKLLQVSYRSGAMLDPRAFSSSSTWCPSTLALCAR